MICGRQCVNFTLMSDANVDVLLNIIKTKFEKNTHFCEAIPLEFWLTVTLWFEEKRKIQIRYTRKNHPNLQPCLRYTHYPRSSQ